MYWCIPVKQHLYLFTIGSYFAYTLERAFDLIFHAYMVLKFVLKEIWYPVSSLSLEPTRCCRSFFGWKLFTNLFSHTFRLLKCTFDSCIDAKSSHSAILAML